MNIHIINMNQIKAKLQEHPWQNFTYVSLGVGPLPMRFGLNLKYTHEIGISTRS